VFVHGLFGDTTQTWTHASGTSFFRLLHEDPRVSQRVDVFAYGVTSTMFGSGSLNIREAATALDERFQANRIWDYDNVVFVAHSMGGLVTMRHLVNNRDRLAKVPLIALYATPMDGADIANIAQHVAENPALAQMLNADANEFLATLNEDWVRIQPTERPMVRCAYETARTGPMMIVQRRSAVRYCEGNLVAIGGSNHIDIVKPDRAEHLSVVMLVNALEQVVFGRTQDPRVEVPDFSENDAGEWVFRYRAASRDNRASLNNTGSIPLRYHIGPPSDDKLLLTPRPTPRSIPVNGREEIEFFLISIGQPQSEYTFPLRLEPMGERVVRVQLDDPQALIAQQSRDLEAVVAAMTLHISANSGQLAALPEEQQRQQIVDVARSTLASRYGNLPEDKQWLLTSDVLSLTSFNDLTTTALRNVERLAPETAKAPAIWNIAEHLYQRTGTRVFEAQLRPDLDERAFVPPAVDDGSPARTPMLELQDQGALARLATEMEQIPSQRHNGLVLQGDLHRRAGHAERAVAAYQAANAIVETPELRSRLDRVRRRRGEAER
jgi:pimeloyl-ACP methyl ester carboxylesterase